MTHRLSHLTEKTLEEIDKCPIIPLGDVYHDDCSLDYTFDTYLNVKLDNWCEIRDKINYLDVAPDHKFRMMYFSYLDKYMTTVEHPGFTNVPRTGKQFSWYKNYIKQKKNTIPVTFDPPKLEHYIPQPMSLSMGLKIPVIKKITKKKKSKK